MKPPGGSAMTLVELLVIISIIGVLAALALPSITVGPVRSPMTRALSNQKQLHLATEQMARDGVSTGETNLGWPGDTDGSFSNWAHQLVQGGYLTTNDLCKLLSAEGRIVNPGTIPHMHQTAIFVYAVDSESPGNTVLFSSANFTNTPTGGQQPHKRAKPFGNKGFVLFRKAGDGAILQTRQAGNTNLIGAFAPLCR